MELTPRLAARYAQLTEIIRGMDGLVIGFSGGVDSTLLARVAHDVLGQRAIAVTARSASLPARELAQARALADRIGIRLVEIDTDEVSDERYRANPVNRCYYCKAELFRHLQVLADREAIAWIAYGENEDDRGDHRPGATAAREAGVRAPLREAGMTRAEIEALSQFLDLPTWDKPALACLASRIPYGTEVTPERLLQVERAEDVLWELGFRGARVRFHHEVARIEVPPAEMAQLLAVAPRVVAGVKAAGFRFVALDLEGYRRGSLNTGLVLVQLEDGGVL